MPSSNLPELTIKAKSSILSLKTSLNPLLVSGRLPKSTFIPILDHITLLYSTLNGAYTTPAQKACQEYYYRIRVNLGPQVIRAKRLLIEQVQIHARTVFRPIGFLISIIQLDRIACSLCAIVVSG